MSEEKLAEAKRCIEACSNYLHYEGSLIANYDLNKAVSTLTEWIVNRAVELGRVDDERQFKNIYGQTCWDKEYKKTPEEILEQIKKELGEK